MIIDSSHEPESLFLSKFGYGLFWDSSEKSVYLLWSSVILFCFVMLQQEMQWDAMFFLLLQELEVHDFFFLPIFT